MSGSRGKNRRRGGAIFYVLAFVTVLAAAAATWEGSLRAIESQATRGLARARARAVAEAAWARARVALEKGKSAVAPLEPLLDGRARVAVEPSGTERLRVTVDATVGHDGGRLACRLRLDVRLGPAGEATRSLVVLAREELTP